MKNRAIKYTLIFALVGIVVISLIAYAERQVYVTSEYYQPYTSLSDNVKTHITRGHLLLDQLLTRNSSLDFKKDVLPHFNTSQKILGAAYNGQEAETGNFQR